jgi:5-methylcytosine-specific restriction endonuclease McrA
MSRTDQELEIINNNEKRLNHIEREFHKINLDDVKGLEGYLIDDKNSWNGLYLRVGPYQSKERQRIIKDVKLWFSKVDYKSLMRIKSTSLIRKQVINREYDKIKRYEGRIIQANKEIDEVKSKGWSDSLFTSKPKKKDYDAYLMKKGEDITRDRNWISEHGPYVRLLNRILDIADKYDSEIYKIDTETKRIKEAANKRYLSSVLNAKISKAARADGKIRSEAPTYKKFIRKTEMCPYCQNILGNAPHLDHIYPVSKGGLNLEENLVYCCQSCNSKKSDKGLREFCISGKFSYIEVTDRLALMGKHV